MAEIEFSVLSRACLKGRNPDGDALQSHIAAYETRRNASGATIDGASASTTPELNSIASTTAFPTLTKSP